MTGFNDILDSLVKEVKKSEDFSSVRFIKAGRITPAERPMRGFIVACGMGSVEAKERECTAKLVFTVYAPARVGERELSKVSQSLMQTVLIAQTDGTLSLLKLSEASFDSDLAAFTQTLTAEVTISEPEPEPEPEPELPDEESSAEIYVEGELIPNVLSYKMNRQSERYAVRELLSAETGEYLTRGDTYTLRIAVGSNDNPFRNLRDFTIETMFGEYRNVFSGCRVTQVTETADESGNVTTEYNLTAQRFAEIKEVVDYV